MLSPICEIETQLVRALRLVHAKAEAGARHEGGRRRIASSRGRIVTMGVVRADVPVDIIGRREPQSSSERRHLTAAEIANAGPQNRKSVEEGKEGGGTVEIGKRWKNKTKK